MATVTKTIEINGKPYRAPAAAPAPPRFDKEEVRPLTVGRGVEILTLDGGLRADQLDGRHQPCPKCPDGGTDRFRAFEDVNETGGLICNKCGAFPDIFASLAFALGLDDEKDFAKILGIVANRVGAVPGGGSARKANGRAAANGATAAAATTKAAKGSQGKKSKADPAKDLKWMEWSAELAAMFIAEKTGITEAAILAAGGRMAKYVAHTVIAFPVVGLELDASKACGWLAVNATGNLLPKFDKNGKIVGQVGKKLTFGSASGLINVAAIERLKAGGVEVCWKCEGLTDMLALSAAIPTNLADRHVAVSNSAGAGEGLDWMAKFLATSGASVNVLHDADEPGQKGAVKAATQIASHGVAPRLVVLPYPVEENHGKDVRDWLNEGKSYSDLLALAEGAEVVQVEGAGGNETVDDLPSISNYEVIEVQTKDGETSKQKAPIPMGDIIEQIYSLTGGWPRSAGGVLFVDDPQSDDPSRGVDWFDKRTTAGLFGWMRGKLSVKWAKGGEFVAPGELFAELERTSKRYDAIELLPHEPPIASIYYRSTPPEPGDGKSLRWLLERFRPETTIDRDLIQAAIMTVIWGGPPGCRPAFVITSDWGRGVGKTALAEMIGRLCGGFVDVSLGEDFAKIKTRLLSSGARTKRVVLLDNVKAAKLSLAELESMITNESINGTQLYTGDGSRPNLLTWFVTLNGVSLATDIAQRSIIIKLLRGENDGNWYEGTSGFINEHRQAIIGDIIAELRSDPYPLAKFTRWATWERDILSRLPDPAEAQRVIQERQVAANTELDEADIIEEYFAEQLRRLGYNPDTCQVRTPSAVAARWFCWATNDTKLRTVAVSKRLHQMASEGQLHRIAPDACHSYGRGFIFTGMHADNFKLDISNDLEIRIAEAERKKRTDT